MKAIRNVATIPIPPGQGPGPAGGGPAHGYLWSDYRTGRGFESIKDMKEWMNKRTEVLKQLQISFAQHQQLSMHHMDLVRRNISVLPDSSLCFVDWAFAGFFPDIFEIHTFQELVHQDSFWFEQLLHVSPKPDNNDNQVLPYLSFPAFVHIKYRMYLGKDPYH